MKTIEITHTTGNFSFDGLELILSENGEVIADIRSCNHDGEELENLVYNRSQEEAEANGDFIATACNNHYSLLEALKTITQRMELEQMGFNEPMLLKSAIRKAKSAIEKAE